ncbi:MAG: hypothetical protein K1060chlam2_01361 [Chlamydiae bacterium]|nr:hypothetical protein [Chlamydiota bacterium]
MRILNCFLVGMALCWGSATALVKEQSPENWKQEVETIDQATVKLTDLRNKELASAAWAQNQGDRLQFQSHSLIDARRYWNQADTSREIAARYQEEIDKLEVRKKYLLEAHGKADVPPSET